jgi:uncharacterized glyoxalase superfamily protein PhnB
MSNNVRPIPDGYHSISAALVCRDAARAIEFYKNVLGATQKELMMGANGKVMHAELRIGDSIIMLSDEIPGMTTAPTPASGHPMSLFLYTEDVDSLFSRAEQAGCQVTMPLADMFWGDRYGKFVDPFGHQWGVATHVEDVAPEEMKRRSDEFMKQMAKGAGAN